MHELFTARQLQALSVGRPMRRNRYRDKNLRLRRCSVTWSRSSPFLEQPLSIETMDMFHKSNRLVLCEFRFLASSSRQYPGVSIFFSEIPASTHVRTEVRLKVGHLL